MQMTFGSRVFTKTACELKQAHLTRAAKWDSSLKASGLRRGRMAVRAALKEIETAHLS